MAAFKDERGATRHAMSRERLAGLYNELDNFIADLTFEEVESSRHELMNVKTLIAMRMREETRIIINRERSNRL